MQSSGDISDEFKLKSGCSSSHSQDRFDELSQDSGFRFKSSSFLSSDDGINSYLTDDYSTQSSQFSIVSSTVETNESDDGWTTAGSTKGNLGRLNNILKYILLFNIRVKALVISAAKIPIGHTDILIGPDVQNAGS